jgi:hypothetical protein
MPDNAFEAFMICLCSIEAINYDLMSILLCCFRIWKKEGFQIGQMTQLMYFTLTSGLQVFSSHILFVIKFSCE